MLARVVVLGVVGAVLLQPAAELLLQLANVGRGRIPVDVERLDLRAKEVVGAARADLRQPLRVDAVDKPQHLRPMLHRADESLLLRHLPAKPRQHFGQHAGAVIIVQRTVLRAAKSLIALVVIVKIAGGRLDKLERQVVAGFVVVVPVDESVLPHEQADELGIGPGDCFHLQAQVKARPLPADVAEAAAEDLPVEPLLVGARRDRDNGIGVHVIDVPGRQEAVQRRVDATCARVEVVRHVRVETDHVVLGLRFRSDRIARSVDVLDAVEPGEFERGEIRPLARPEVAAAALDPEHVDLVAGERILLEDLGRRVAAAGVGDALVAAEQIAAVDEPLDRIGRRGRVVPEIVHKSKIARLHVSPCRKVWQIARRHRRGCP